MTPTPEQNARFAHALAQFKHATAELDAAWNDIPGDGLQGYPSYLPSFDEFALEVAAMEFIPDDYELWIDDARTVLVRRWANGSVEVCLRGEQDAIWGPPVHVEPEAT